ncbi:PRC-barrel domain-containing protein [Mycobacterium sp. NPDC003449]
MTALDARLHLLDRQLLNDNGDPVGIVDDLELDGIEPDTDIAAGSPAPRVTAILCGQVVATRIFGGTPPRSRLQEVPWKLVSAVGTAVRLGPTDIPFDTDWVERWLRDHIVGRIPGGRHAAE